MAELTGSTRKQCEGRRKDGQPCTGFALSDSRFCFAHDPNRAQERAEARSKGGANRANVVRLRGLAPPRLQSVFDLLEQALVEVHEGRLHHLRGQAMASLARAMVDVIQAGELEQRVRTLEALKQSEEAGKWTA